MRKIQFLGGVHEKQYKGEGDCLKGGLGQFAYLGGLGGLGRKRGHVFERGRYVSVN